MDVVCSLDVHKDSVFTCILKADDTKTIRKYGALTSDLDRLRDGLVVNTVESVALESIGIYQKPIWCILSWDFFDFRVNFRLKVNLQRTYISSIDNPA